MFIHGSDGPNFAAPFLFWGAADAAGGIHGGTLPPALVAAAGFGRLTDLENGCMILP